MLSFLLATLPAAITASQARDGSWVGLTIHLALAAFAAVAAFAERPRKFRGAFTWLPLASIPVVYAELPFLMSGVGAGYADATVQGWERALFGSPATSLAALLPWVWLSESLHLAYFLYYPLIYVPPLLLTFRGAQEELERTVTALIASFALCFAVFVVFPVQGPRYLMDSPAPQGWMRGIVLQVLEAGSSRGAAFPSSHVAVAVTQVGMAWRRGSRLTWLYGTVTVLLAIGAVYGGFHYGVDVVAGLVVGAAVAAVVSRGSVGRRHMFSRSGV